MTKQDRKNGFKFSVRLGFLTAFLPRTFSSSMDLCHFIPRDVDLSVLKWHQVLKDSPILAQCNAKRIVFCKCNTNKEHEFLIIYFHSSDDSESNISAPVVVDWSVRVQDARNSSGTMSPSLSNTPAVDNIHLMGTEDRLPEYLLTFGSYTELCTVNFIPDKSPSALQIATLLLSVHLMESQYDLYRPQCYWFAGIFWEALPIIFSPEYEQCPHEDKRSRYNGFAINTKGSVATAVERYHVLWEATSKEVREKLKRLGAEVRAEIEVECRQLLAKEKDLAEREKQRLTEETERLRAKNLDLQARLAAAGLEIPE